LAEFRQQPAKIPEAGLQQFPSFVVVKLRKSDRQISLTSAPKISGSEASDITECDPKRQ
jgi:hypothetical protein